MLSIDFAAGEIKKDADLLITRETPRLQSRGMRIEPSFRKAATLTFYLHRIIFIHAYRDLWFLLAPFIYREVELLVLVI